MKEASQIFLQTYRCLTTHFNQFLQFENAHKDYVLSNMKRQKIDSDEFSGIELRLVRASSTKVFVYFGTKQTAAAILKSHTRTMDGRRVHVQQAIVSNLRKVSNTTSVTKQAASRHATNKEHQHRRSNNKQVSRLARTRASIRLNAQLFI